MDTSEQFEIGRSGWGDDIAPDSLPLLAHLGRNETRELARSLVPAQPVWPFRGHRAQHRASGRH